VTTESGPQEPTEAPLLFTPQPPELHPPELHPPELHPQLPAAAATALPPPRQLQSLQPPAPAPRQPVKPITAARAASMNMDRIFKSF